MKTALAAFALVTTLALTLAASTARAGDRSCTDSRDTAEIRASLLDVESSLRAASAADASAEQQAARAGALDELHRYAVAGVFPHNHDSPAPHAIFVDEHGALCAFANLLAFSGRSAFVQRVAAERNAAKVADLANEPAVTSWSLETGISLVEAAQIQRPAYNFRPRTPVAPTSVEPTRVERPEPDADASSAPTVQASGVLLVVLAAGGLVWRRRRAAGSLPTV